MLNQNAKRQRDGHGGVTRVVLRVRIIACAIVVVGLLSRAEAAVFNIPAGNVALINAIKAANANHEDNTITLAAGTYSLTALDNMADGPNGLPSIAGTLTLHGAGPETTVLARADNAPEFRIVHVAATGILTLDGLTVAGGSGGIFNLGTLTVLNSTVSGNSSYGYPAVGGIFNTGTLTMLNVPPLLEMPPAASPTAEAR